MTILSLIVMDPKVIFIVFVGGLLHNHMGNVIFSFSVNIGNCSVINAKLWAILIGVKISWSRGFKFLIVKSDSQSAIDLLAKDCLAFCPCSSLVHDI